MSKNKRICKHCGFEGQEPGITNHIKTCYETQQILKEELNENGNFHSFKHTGDEYVDAQKRRDLAKKEHGYGNLKSAEDYAEETSELLVKLKLKAEDEKTDALGFTKDFYNFLGIGVARDYRYAPSESIKSLVNDMRGYTTDTTQSFYTPTDNMYGTATGSDSWFDFGRVPVSHLMALTSKRIGVAFRCCNGIAHDVYDNRFDIVKYSDREKPIQNPEIDRMFEWMDQVYYWEKNVDVLDFDGRTGLGHLVVEKYIKEEQTKENFAKKKALTHPERLQSFSAFWMTPININQQNVLDYNKHLWNFRGGYQGAEVHHSRIYPLEMRREELGLRGLSLPELCWVACMCYLNVQYYILKALAQLGTVTIGVQVDQDFPTPTVIQRTLENLNVMKANDFYVLGRNSTLLIDNTASKLGSGINDFMEFLKEDMSSAWIFPKNQLFGRSDGGGISGAGAIVTKEDYLGSNIATKQLSITGDQKRILTDLCNWKLMEGKTLRFNIDLHKTEEQRLQEQMLREGVAQAEILTKQQKLQMGLFRKQIKLQKEMADVQLEMLQKDPEAFMQMSEEDEANKGKGSGEGSTPKKDFTNDFKVLWYKYNILYKEAMANQQIMDYLAKDTKKLNKLYNREDFARRKQIEWGKKAK